MLCIDEFDDKNKTTNVSLYGNSAHMPHRHIEIVFKPCVPQELTFNNSNKNATECLMEDSKNKTKLDERLKSTKEWLGAPDLLLIYNT